MRSKCYFWAHTTVDYVLCKAVTSVYNEVRGVESHAVFSEIPLVHHRFFTRAFLPRTNALPQRFVWKLDGNLFEDYVEK
jgi:hypothetical protein